MGRVYSEHAGAGSYRPVFQELMRDAHGGKFGVLLISAIDRLGRSMSGNCAALLQFERAGIRVVSAREPWLDSGGPARALLVAVFSWVAEQERQLISERTKKGLVRVKAAGTRLGRPKRHVDQRALVLLKGGDSLRQVAQRFKIPKSTLARHLAANTRVP
jgi:DNA invertase Pin-like site-specific DNA recombinase